MNILVLYHNGTTYVKEDIEDYSSYLTVVRGDPLVKCACAISQVVGKGAVICEECRKDVIKSKEVVRISTPEEIKEFEVKMAANRERCIAWGKYSKTPEGKEKINAARIAAQEERMKTHPREFDWYEFGSDSECDTEEEAIMRALRKGEGEKFGY